MVARRALAALVLLPVAWKTGALRGLPLSTDGRLPPGLAAVADRVGTRRDRGSEGWTLD